ncbi:MAG: cytidylate kinase-like family protein [Bacteroidales bacterium]|jgi:cytidylate kinase|nr:cytidylate kinase-like family protein [Bacteroidales bacterium]
MNNHIIITIGRQFGSGGRAIGRQLAKNLNIAYYDKELLAEAAKESGLCGEIFEKADERASNRLSYAFSVEFPNMGLHTPYPDILSNEQLFLFQSNAIENIAAKGESCVLVGRCADYVLREHPNLLSLFIHNKPENRIRNIVERQHVSAEAAAEMMKKTDKSRASYYKYYTDKEWGMSSSYHFSIDVSLLGFDHTVEMIGMIIEKRQKRQLAGEIAHR